MYTTTKGAKVTNFLVHVFRKPPINQAETAWRDFNRVASGTPHSLQKEACFKISSVPQGRQEAVS